MIAADTNVLVRMATNDTAQEAAAVHRAITGHSVFVAKTVLLETDWVLRSMYAFSGKEVLAFITFITNDPIFVFEDERQVQDALQGTRDGLEFADALHLAAAEGKTFYTLDKTLHRRAKQPVMLIKPDRQPLP
jgi:predicted nucleic-acid-binding protein